MIKLSFVSFILVVYISLCLTIRVPVDWNNESEVKFNEPILNDKTNDEIVKKPIPNQYFEYTAKKPQFAIDVAASHNVKSPEKLYTSYPIRPYTGINKPDLGKHHILNPEKSSFKPYQRYVSKNNDLSYVTPASASFDVYHPYKAEEPALEEMYKDPVLDKIRNDLRDSKDRLQKYENDAGQSDISKDEYLESPEQTDYRYSAQKNKQSQFEIHRPMRRPVYYRPPLRYNYRENILNKKLRHPWNQNYAKVTPMHYRPIKKHLYNLRQQHALKFDDEQNEYPQLPIKESYIEKPDGYDIYEKGRDNFFKLRNNVDESINKAILENRPSTSENLELKSNDNNESNNHDSYNHDSQEEEFVPIKNYAQVRKTETTKHLPRQSAFLDAENLDEIKNAPRLREAVKSTKAQIVYSEEGYEDSAYDHAGEHKHASDHEGHGGYLKENESSGGKYKTPSESAKYEDASGSTYRDKVIHGEKWKNNEQDKEDETDSEDYSANEQDDSEESDIYADTTNVENTSESDVSDEKPKEWLKSEEENTETLRSKRQETSSTDSSTKDINKKHIVNKREFKIPQIELNTTYLTGDQISQLKIPQEETNDTDHEIRLKYPYYFKKLDQLNSDSPLRYAENLKLIPKKTLGGTEFYDSRKEIVCPAVEEDVDPIPEKLKKDTNPNDSDSDKDAEFTEIKNKQRLEGLGDKIDCLKSKYFGANPLDSPFFKEDFIASPEPITKPDLGIFNRNKKEKIEQITQLDNRQINHDKDIFKILDEIINKQKIIQQEKMISGAFPGSIHLNFNKKQEKIPHTQNGHRSLNPLSEIKLNNSNIIFSLSKNAENLNNSQPLVMPRQKRATPFMYEPYKIIKESQVVDSKKTTTTNNISPLIKQLQSSRFVDRVTANQNKDQVVKRNTNTRNYKDIGKVDRQNQYKNESNDFQDTDFIDVSIDKRRGEPRYELQHRNHKNHYTPVNNKKAISLDEYRNQIGVINNNDTKLNLPLRRATLIPTSKVNFDISKYLPFSEDTQNSAASNAVTNIIITSTMNPSMLTDEDGENEDDEEYDDYENDKETQDDKLTSTTTESTTTETFLRKRKPIRILTTTKPTTHVEVDSNNMPLLRLKTRFRNSQTVPEENKNNRIKSKVNSDYTAQMPNITPNLREKKKKVSKSTIVTDTKSYGEEDDDMRKEDIDALIGVKHDTDDYLPEYERHQNKKGSKEPEHKEKNDEDEYDTDDEDNDDDDEEEDEKDEEDEDDNIDENSNEDETTSRIRMTTPEPTKRTLPKTTETTITTTEITIIKDKIKPTILKKKIEVHRELPVNRLSPNVTHFKQDIKEVEIIKTMPPKIRQKTRKNLEALDLYKDENLAKEVNKLGGVEIFREDLDVRSGPKHGGNYRSIETKYSTEEPSKRDVETSQSETRKLIESKSLTNSSRQSNRRGSNVKHSGRNAELQELSYTTDSSVRSLHGGNLKLSPKRGHRPGNKSEKIIELSEENDRNIQLHGGNLKSRRGKNNERNYREEHYKNSEIVQDPDNYKTNSDLNEKKTKDDPDRSGNAAVLLSSYVRAVPILTTAPPFIVDPSKRRYYYVDV